ncbi:hypothetical protein [Streptacidiphilus neutrinimicus]|uniref:hypothetical protein n=1 Tax=Streptacidiphilus neutrinimicus TaxID=105420 RepID=UPI001269DB8E|nr:hypothetical protein [Streptacidiphilus neutrinimicus]
MEGNANTTLGAGAHHNNTGDLTDSGDAIVSQSPGGVTVTGINTAPITVINQPKAQANTWLAPGQYLKQMKRGPIYSHRWRLAGRAQIMDRLLSLAYSEEGSVALLVGRGGVGKTRVLTAFCEAIEGAAPSVAVRILGQSPEINQEAFDQLPNEGKLLVVIDDAHDPTFPLGRIIAGIQEANGAANVLVALRPYGLPHAYRELSRVNMHSSEAAQIEVGDLELEDAESLAREVLDEANHGYALRLAAAARDCPLLIVTGAALINRGDLDPRRFEGEQQLHVELTRRLADALAIDSNSTAPRHDLLSALAAFQPVHLDDPAAFASLEALTGSPPETLSSHLTALEQAGVVLRHNTAMRIVPDLLGDALLIKAARHPGTGIATGYLNRALEAAQGRALINLVVNAGRVDWQDRDVSANGLIEPVWAWLAESFMAAADAQDRARALEVVAKVAFFQPRRALELVSWAMAHPSAPITADIGFGYKRAFTDDDVRQAVPSVLRAVAYHPEFLAGAAGLLWELGRDDARPTNQHPDHPLRVLDEFASFTRFGPTVYQQILVAQVERWLRRQSAESLHQPLTVLSPILATDGHDEVWRRPDTLTFIAYMVPPDPGVLELRDQVLELAFTELGNAQLERAAAAVKLIGAALSLPHGGFGITVTPEMRQPWTSYIEAVVGRLQRCLAEHPLEPTILVAVREELRWLAQYGPEELRGPVTVVLDSIPRTVDNELARALHGGPTDPTDSPDAPDWHQATEDLFARVVEQLTAWSDSEVIARMRALLGQEQKVFASQNSSARLFLGALVSRRPSIGELLCKHALSAPTDPLASLELVSVSLTAMGHTAGGRAVHWGRSILSDGNVELVREVAMAFGRQRGQADLLPGEADLLRDLAAHEDGAVHSATLGAVLRLGAQHKGLAIELLTVPRDDDAGLHELAMALGLPSLGPISWADLTRQQQDDCLARLTACRSIDSYEILQLLGVIAQTAPAAVVQLLQARVEACENASTLAPQALPHSWQASPPFRDHQSFPQLLHQIGDWLTAAPGSAWRRFLGAKLFALVAAPYDEHVIRLIDEYLDDPDPARLRTVATILSEAPRDLVWNIAFVRRCLRAADRHGDKLLASMQGALESTLNSGVFSAVPGQPYPKDVEQHEKAKALAGRCAPGSVEEEFYLALAESAQNSIRRTRHDLPPDDRDW